MLKKAKLSVSIEGIRGLSFHLSLPWILVGGQSGSVYIYDYFAGSLIGTFLGHEKPTCAVCFHPTQPLFASGSDDTRLKLWHFSTRRCVYTFAQHADRIQSAEFHRTLPWLLTACADGGLRVFNWQNRVCLCTVLAHSAPVSSAAFHPEDDLIVSASRDETVRVWDYSELKKKYSTSTGIHDTASLTQRIAIEKPSSPATWAAFHPTKQLLASCHEDGVVRVWRYKETEGWEVQTLSGHGNKATSCLFLAKHDVLVSCAEDRTVIVWDYNEAKVLHRGYEEGKVWSLGVNKGGNYVGEGHEKGFRVFKVEHEQPPFERVTVNVVCRIFNGELQLHDLLVNKTNSIKKLSNDNEIFTRYKFHINPFDSSGKVFLIMKCKTIPPYDSQYEVRLFPNSMVTTDSEPQSHGKGTAVFVGRDNICVLSNEELKLVTYNGTVKRTLDWRSADSSAGIYPATLGKLFIGYQSSLVELYDVTAKKVIGRVRSGFNKLKRVVWSKGLGVVALVFKNGIAVCTKDLAVLCKTPLKETILTAYFDNNDVLIYSTHQHLKYLLPDGSVGIITGTEHPLYPICIANSTLHYMRRGGAFSTRKVCMDEYSYRLSVLRGNLEGAQRVLELGDMWGSSTIRYLDAKGFPELALKYERSQRGRFALAISAGQLDTALNAAMMIKEKDCFVELGSQALRLGNAEIAEVCFQRILGFEQLVFLYLVTGNFAKLKKFMTLTRGKLKNPILSYQIAVALGDAQEMIRVLADTKHYCLAQKVASTYGSKDMESRLQQRTNQEMAYTLQRLVFPMKEIAQAAKVWPMKVASTVKKAKVEIKEERKGIAELIESDKALDNIINGMTISNEIDEESLEKSNRFELNVEEGVQGDWDAGLDLLEEFSPKGDREESAVAPSHGLDFALAQCKNSLVAGHFAALGKFEVALRLLQKQIAVVNPLPLKNGFVRTCLYSKAKLSLVPGLGRQTLQLIGSEGYPLGSLDNVSKIYEVLLPRQQK